MKKLRAPLLFMLPFLPIAAIAGYFTILYQLDFLDTGTIDLVVSQIGSTKILIAVYIVQTTVYSAFCSFFGHILSSRLGLMKPIRFEKKAAIATLVLSAAGGILFSLDYWTFGAVIPGIQQASVAMLNWYTIAACILYGGIIEELMLRLFFYEPDRLDDLESLLSKTWRCPSRCFNHRQFNRSFLFRSLTSAGNGSDVW